MKLGLSPVLLARKCILVQLQITNICSVFIVNCCSLYLVLRAPKPNILYLEAVSNINKNIKAKHRQKAVMKNKVRILL